MCGIAGISSGNQAELVKRMIAAIAHRGPNGSGLHQGPRHTLGHVRLSIIDPDGGAQPMSGPNGRSHIVFSGEIYNHIDLRRQLKGARFRTKSDTEVILHLCERDAVGHVHKLDGMFAYAIIKDGGLILARDPLGIKPLYLGRRDDATVFASEIKAVLAVSDEVTEFPPGHVYAAETGIRPYYELAPGDADIADAQTACAALRKRLEAAVRKRLLADVPLGVFLSGGLDSSLVAALACRHKQPLDSFSVGTQYSSDRAHAWEAASFLGTHHHERIYSIAQAIEALPDVIYHLESFDCALVRSAIPNYFLARLASQYVKVALSGEGADELFAGYHYLKGLEPQALQRELLHITRALHNTNLQRCDRMSMAHGLEARVPFLDLTVVDYAFRIPVRLKLHRPNRVEKNILRQVASEILPAKIAWRKKEKFAAGAGLGDRLARFAQGQISDAAFAREREIADRVFLRSKEELLYYRIFREMFPADKLLPLIGRSRSV